MLAKRHIDFETFVDAIVASIAAAIGAAFTLVFFVFVVSSIVGIIGYRLWLLTDEGEAWIGISFGIPVGLLSAVIVAVYCFRRVFKYGER